MPDKGKTMSQTYYERQSKLIKLYQDSFVRKDLAVKDTITGLRLVGFSETMAARRVSEWSIQINNQVSETEKNKKRRIKEQATLEKYIFRMKLGKKKYEEYLKALSKFKEKNLTCKEFVLELMQLGHSRKFSEYIAEKWETGKW